VTELLAGVSTLGSVAAFSLSLHAGYGLLSRTLSLDSVAEVLSYLS